MKYFTKKMLLLLTLATLSAASCSKSGPHDLFCEDISRPTQIKITYVDNQGQDILFSSTPSLSLDSLYIYHYFLGEELPNNGDREYSTPYSIEGGHTKHLLIQGSAEKEAYFFIRFGNGPIDKIYMKGSLDSAQHCPQNKVDELYQNGSKISMDKKTGIWKLVR